QDAALHRAVRPMGARQIADAHEELADDLAAGEKECLLEELHPVRLVARMMAGNPAGERAELAAQHLDPLGVLDGRVDLQAIADDAGVGQQAGAVALAIAGDAVDLEAVVGALEGPPLLEDRWPARAGLVGLADETLEERCLVLDGKAVFPLMVRAVPGIAGCDIAIAAHRRLSSPAAAKRARRYARGSRRRPRGCRRGPRWRRPEPPCADASVRSAHGRARASRAP